MFSVFIISLHVCLSLKVTHAFIQGVRKNMQSKVHLPPTPHPCPGVTSPTCPRREESCPVCVLLMSAHSTVLPILHICSFNQYLLTSCYMSGTVLNIRDPVGSQCTHDVHCERETLTNITPDCITKNSVKCSEGKGCSSNTMCHERTRLRLKGQRRLPGEDTT